VTTQSICQLDLCGRIMLGTRNPLALTNKNELENNVPHILHYSYT